MITGGLVGIRGSGRTELFDLLAGGAGFPAPKAGKFLAQAAVLAPSDERLDAISRICGASKVTRAEYTIVDFASVGLGETGGRESEWLNVIRTLDLLLVVLPLFLDGDGEDALRKRIDAVSSELVLADLLQVEARLDRIDKELMRAARVNRPELEHERALQESLRERLNAGLHLRGMDLSDQDLRLISGFGFLTHKPMAAVVNTGENGVPRWEGLVKSVRDSWPYPHTGAAAVAAQIEREAMALDQTDRAEFLASLGIKEAAVDRVSRAVHSATEAITVYTCKDGQAQAWRVAKLTTALQFAEIVHSDIARGFIRAETVSCSDLLACGSYAEARQRGLVRREGRDHLVADGDVIEVLFSR